MFKQVTKHQTENDHEPDISQDKITLYNAININLSSKPKWYIEKYNALGKVPTLVVGGKEIITESDKVIEYIDENLVNPKHKLLNVCQLDGYKKTKELFEAVMQFIFKVFYNMNNEEWTKEQECEWLSSLIKLNDFIKGPYLFGDQLSLADFYIIPFIERYEFLMARLLKISLDQVKEGYPSHPDELKSWPKLIAYRDTLRTQDWYNAARNPISRYAEFLHAYLITKQPVYDD
ncbi:Glutathione S-transferase omega-2 [Cichlidogyrus casuarinus]|uniref:Glutathione S-transferase omega-2 n=1 Tax=Cichlidogyrus casuarinus TaxID=1844966 RepID=A0ABD2QAK7_9PLAT